MQAFIQPLFGQQSEIPLILIFLKVERTIRSTDTYCLSVAYAVLKCLSDFTPHTKDAEVHKCWGYVEIILSWLFLLQPVHDTHGHISWSFIQILLCHHSSGPQQQTKKRGSTPASAWEERLPVIQRLMKPVKIKLFWQLISLRQLLSSLHLKCNLMLITCII